VPLRKTENLSYGLNSGLGMAYNPVVGKMQRQVSVAGAVNWAHDRINAGANVAFGTSIGTDSDETSRVVSGGATVGYLLGAAVSLSGGIRLSSQVLPPPQSLFSVPAWGVFAGVALRAPPLAF
jgi:hypothetical protein